MGRNKEVDGRTDEGTMTTLERGLTNQASFSLSFFDVRTSSFPTSLKVTPILRLFSNWNVVVIRASWPNFSYIYKNGRMMGHSETGPADVIVYLV